MAHNFLNICLFFPLLLIFFLFFCCFVLQYLASLGIQSLVQQGATQGKTAHKLMDALKDTDILHWKHSLSELIEISLAQTTSIWRMYGKRSVPSQFHPSTHASARLTVDGSLKHTLPPTRIRSNQCNECLTCG